MKFSIQVFLWEIDRLLKIFLETPLTWCCHPEKIHLKSQSIEYLYPSDFEKMKTEDFPDPLNSLIGFVIKYEVMIQKFQKFYNLFLFLEWRSIFARFT